MALQTLVSRENDPLQPAVVTVGSFHSGTKSNIISDDAKLALTVRSYTPETRKLLLDGIRRIVRGEAIAAGMPEDRMPTVEIEQPSADATFNTPKLSAHLLDLFGSHFGQTRVVEPKPIMADGKSVTAGDLDLQTGIVPSDDVLPINLRAAREIADRKAIRQAMSRTDNNISGAAKLLGISRPTLYDLLKQYRLQA